MLARDLEWDFYLDDEEEIQAACDKFDEYYDTLALQENLHRKEEWNQ